MTRGSPGLGCCRKWPTAAAVGCGAGRGRGRVSARGTASGVSGNCRGPAEVGGGRPVGVARAPGAASWISENRAEARSSGSRRRARPRGLPSSVFPEFTRSRRPGEGGKPPSRSRPLRMFPVAAGGKSRGPAVAAAMLGAAGPAAAACVPGAEQCR